MDCGLWLACVLIYCMGYFSIFGADFGLKWIVGLKIDLKCGALRFAHRI